MFRQWILVACVLLLFTVCLTPILSGCDDDDDDDVSPSADDDTSADDDDDNDDNDDDNNDDNDDNNDNDDDDDTAPPLISLTPGTCKHPFEIGEVLLQQIVAGAPGRNGVGADLSPDGHLTVAATYGAGVVVHEQDEEGAWRAGCLDEFGDDPRLDRGPDGVIHGIFRDYWTDALMVTQQVGEAWTEPEMIPLQAKTVHQFRVGHDGALYVGCIDLDTKVVYVLHNAAGEWDRFDLMDYEDSFNNIYFDFDVDEQGVVHAILSGPSDVRYVRYEGEDAEEEIVAEDSRYPAIRLASDDSLRAFFERYELDHVYWSQILPGVWVPTRVYDYFGTVSIRTADGWEADEVDAGGYMLTGRYLELDAEDYAHVLYPIENSYPRKLRYATKRPGFWQTINFQEQDEGGYDEDLVVEPDGVAHVLYADTDNQRLRHAHNTQMPWTTETVMKAELRVYGVSPALMPDGTPVAMFHDGVAGKLYSAQQVGDSWTISTLLPELTWFRDFAWDMDGLGRRHLVYQTEPGIVNYQMCDPECGPATQLAAAIYNDARADVDIDADNAVHVVYRTGEYDAMKVMYATNKSGNWEWTLVASHRHDGRNAIYVGEDGVVHIAYVREYEESDDVLFYARIDGDQVEREAVHGDMQRTDIAVGAAPDGTPHLLYSCYIQGGGYGTFYSVKSGSTWQTEQLTDDGFASVDIHVDEGGTPHLLVSAEDLSYFVPGEDGWDVTAIAVGGPEGGSFVLDEQGRFHAIYLNRDTLSYARFPLGLSQ
ncbi:MAG: hypothetical protein P9L99_03720 [Candidatus Lernaella stagnicola]|nr:hypothetical protein [Candidatus Lernaella stagnicola]